MPAQRRYFNPDRKPRSGWEKYARDHPERAAFYRSPAWTFARTAFALVGLLTGGVVAMNLAPAEATHTFRHLVRQINRLESNVATLKSQMRELQHEVFVCELVAENLTFNTPTGTYTDNFVVYDTTACPLATSASGKAEARN